jgi:transmembrane sensor
VASNRQAIEEQAAAWLQRRDGEAWSTEDQVQLTRWLEAGTHHRVAFLRLEAAWAEMNRLQAIGTGYPRGKVPSPEELDSASAGVARDGVEDAREPASRSISWSRRAAIAAGLFAVLAGAAYFASHSLRGDSDAVVQIDNYSTPVGGLVSVPLKDGSTVTLSSATDLRVRLGETERQVELARGEAFFEVAKEPRRPFVVDAGAHRVVAVGTKFAVRQDPADFRVVVTEGSVRIDGASARPELLPAGSVARANGKDIATRTISVPAAESLLSWRSGYIVFHETALADAVAEFNRYNERKIVIEDPRIAAIRLTGKFRSTNIDSFSRLLQMSFPVRAKETAGGIVLSAS